MSFVEYVQERSSVMDAYMESIPPGDVISYDHTFNIRNRTYENCEGLPESYEGLPPVEPGRYKSAKNALLLFVNRRGQVLSCEATKESKSADVIDGLTKIKKRCDANNWTYPKYFVVDDCCASRKTVNQVFPEAQVRQDMKHLLNRILECVSKVCSTFR
jgi:hypothetical protein